MCLTFGYATWFTTTQHSDKLLTSITRSCALSPCTQTSVFCLACLDLSHFILFSCFLSRWLRCAARLCIRASCTRSGRPTPSHAPWCPCRCPSWPPPLVQQTAQRMGPASRRKAGMATSTPEGQLILGTTRLRARLHEGVQDCVGCACQCHVCSCAGRTVLWVLGGAARPSLRAVVGVEDGGVAVPHTTGDARCGCHRSPGGNQAQRQQRQHQPRPNQGIRFPLLLTLGVPLLLPNLLDSWVSL